MQTAKEFDLLNSPLGGMNLIEASAGTGKTFTITGIFIRLLIETGLTVDQILVVTFTEAATNELKERIRNKLRETKEALSIKSSNDPLLVNLIKNNPSENAIKKINVAIRDFDEAAIFTIHGFCNKILREQAFESKGLFDTELVTEQTEILRQVVEDFWRKQMYGESGLFVGYAFEKMNPNSLLELVIDKIGLHFLQIIPEVSVADSKELEIRFEESFRGVKQLWPTSKEIVKKIFDDDNRLNRNRYRKDNIPFWLKAMDVYTTSENAAPVLSRGFEKFTTSTLAKGMKKGYSSPALPFFDVCENHYQNFQRLEANYKNRLIALETELFDYARKELKKRKLEKNIFFFDDLLLNLHAALNQNGNEVASTIRTKFKAALIDEFQDTDPVQYEIFRKIFDHKDSALFLIGDPKQAIYGFRGADIFAYLRAKKEIPNSYTLSKNYRSTPELVTSINTVFSRIQNPFVYEAIPYHKCDSPEAGYREQLRFMNKTDTPFRLWFLDAAKYSDSGKPISKPQARKILSDAVASEIVKLLTQSQQGTAFIGNNPLEEKDIAVLVRTNIEAQLMQDTLRKLNIHSVLYSSANLFESNEALELERILTALVEPKRQRLVKAALATDIIGIRGEELLGWQDDETRLEEWFEKFLLYHKLWLEHGFIRMFKELLTQENLQKRLMSYPDGERRITNLLHLAEILNQTSSDLNLGMTGLLKWLSEQIASKIGPIEEHQLRLESDENAVKLVTMHMCKGLEYPIVFCPFTWSGSYVRNADTLIFHDENREWLFTLDLGSDRIEQNKIYKGKEELAENLRLLYVSLTRAKNRCYLVWGNFSEGKTSALAYLFHNPETLNSENILSSLKDHLKNIDDQSYRADLLNNLIPNSKGTIKLTGLPDPAVSPLIKSTSEEIELSCRDFKTKIKISEGISSYSSLVSQVHHTAEYPDHDSIGVIQFPEASQEEKGPEDKYSSFLNFPRGAKTGTFIHDIFQNLDYTLGFSAIEDLVFSKLHAYGFEIEWLNAVSSMISKLLGHPLTGKNSFSLSQLPNKNRLNELEFYFPLRSTSPNNLKEIFTKTLESETSPKFIDRIEEMNFAPIEGFMKGFIDLVFHENGKYYIIDWKSNYLGNSIENYNRASMMESMISNLYILQYHIYAIALNQYLKLRINDYNYEQHFGGIFYIFLRGVETELTQNQGLFEVKPSGNIINELTKRIINTDDTT